MVLMIFDDGWMGLRDGNGSWNGRLVNIWVSQDGKRVHDMGRWDIVTLWDTHQLLREFQCPRLICRRTPLTANTTVMIPLLLLPNSIEPRYLRSRRFRSHVMMA